MIARDGTIISKPRIERDRGWWTITWTTAPSADPDPFTMVAMDMDGRQYERRTFNTWEKAIKFALNLHCR